MDYDKKSHLESCLTQLFIIDMIFKSIKLSLFMKDTSKLFLCAAAGGALPALARAASLLTNSLDADMPTSGFFVGVLISAIVGVLCYGLIAHSDNTDLKVKHAVVYGIAAPGIITNILSSASGEISTSFNYNIVNPAFAEEMYGTPLCSKESSPSEIKFSNVTVDKIYSMDDAFTSESSDSYGKLISVSMNGPKVDEFEKKSGVKIFFTDKELKPCYVPMTGGGNLKIKNVKSEIEKLELLYKDEEIGEAKIDSDRDIIKVKFDYRIERNFLGDMGWALGLPRSGTPVTNNTEISQEDFDERIKSILNNR